jgi:hypothetical protein
MSEMPLASSKYNLTKALIDALLLYLPPSLPPSVAYTPLGYARTITLTVMLLLLLLLKVCVIRHILIYIVKKQLTCSA